MRYAELKPGLPAYLFTATPSRPRQHERRAIDLARPVNLMDDEFGADEIDDQDMVDAGNPISQTYQLQTLLFTP